MYETVRIHTPEFNNFEISGYTDEVEAAVRSFGRLKDVRASTYDKAVYGVDIASGRQLRLGRMSLSFN